MRRKSLWMIALAAAAAVFFAAAAIYAGTEVADVIKMQTKEYETHTEGIVEFTHKKHSEEYPAKYADFHKLGCGECHHDKDNKPLTQMKSGDPVRRCIECHTKPSERPKGKGAPYLSKKERLGYHAEAIHYNCWDCHIKYNVDMKTSAAPTTCAKCHPGAKNED